MKPLARRVVDMTVSPTISTTEMAVQLIKQGHDVIDLSAGRAADPTPDHILNAARDLLSKGGFKSTPAQGTMELREAAARFIGQKYGLTADPKTEVMVTYGFKHALTMLIPTLLEPGDGIIIEDPAFVSYEPLSRVWGCEVTTVPLLEKNRFRWTEAQLEAAIKPNTKAILLCSPHNPTGVVHNKADLEAIAAVAKRHDLWVITDEIYEWTLWGGSVHIGICTLPGMRERTITIVGLGKAFVMGAWRIGFVFALPEVIKQLVKFQQHCVSCVPEVIQVGALAALAAEQPKQMTDLWKEWEERCRYFSSELDSMPGITCHMPESGYFVWPNITGTGLDSRAFVHELLNTHHIAGLAGCDFGPAGEGYLRFSIVRERKNLERAIPRIRQMAEACAAKKK